MSSCHSEDGRILYPWVMKDVEQLWNTYFSQTFGWRSFTLGKSGSASKAAYRLSITLRQNARWLDCSAKTDIDEIFEQWQTYMLGASAYLEKVGPEKAGNLMNQQVTIRMTFWSFIRPSFKHLHDMWHLAAGNDPDGALASDEERRKEKARILKEFDQTMKGFIKKVAYVSGSGPDSNKRLEQALELASQALCRAEEDLEWSEG